MDVARQSGLEGMAPMPGQAGNVQAAPEWPLQAGGDDLPPVVRHWVASWPHYVAAMRLARGMVEDLRKEEAAVWPSRSSAWSWDPLHGTSIAERGDVALEAITTYAREVLCNGDKRVFSDELSSKILRAGRFNADRENPDFAGYWRALADGFGDGVGQAIQRRQAAMRLRKELSIVQDGEEPPFVRRRPPKMERGGVTFDLGSGWLELRYRGGYEVSSYGRERSRALLGDLQALLGAVDPDHGRFFSNATEDGFDIPYRVDVAGWRWSLFKDKATLWVPQPVALELRASIEDLAPVPPKETCE